MIWYFKQLLPFQYISQYGEFDHKRKIINPKLAIWRMWFGKCFNCKYWDLDNKSSKYKYEDYV